MNPQINTDRDRCLIKKAETRTLVSVPKLENHSTFAPLLTSRLLPLIAILFLFISVDFAQTPTPQKLHYFVKAKLIINPADGKTIDNAVMEVSSGKIVKIEKAKDFKIPTEAQVFDYSDKFIIPGLIDTHAHLYTNLIFGHSTNPALPPLFIAGGVTSTSDFQSRIPKSSVTCSAD